MKYYSKKADSEESVIITFDLRYKRRSCLDNNLLFVFAVVLLFSLAFVLVLAQMWYKEEPLHEKEKNTQATHDIPAIVITEPTTKSLFDYSMEFDRLIEKIELRIKNLNDGELYTDDSNIQLFDLMFKFELILKEKQAMIYTYFAQMSIQNSTDNTIVVKSLVYYTYFLYDIEDLLGVVSIKFSNEYNKTRIKFSLKFRSEVIRVFLRLAVETTNKFYEAARVFLEQIDLTLAISEREKIVANYISKMTYKNIEKLEHLIENEKIGEEQTHKDGQSFIEVMHQVSKFIDLCLFHIPFLFFTSDKDGNVKNIRSQIYDGLKYVYENHKYNFEKQKLGSIEKITNVFVFKNKFIFVEEQEKVGNNTYSFLKRKNGKFRDALLNLLKFMNLNSIKTL